LSKTNFTVSLYHDGLAGALGKFADSAWPSDTSSKPRLDGRDQALCGKAEGDKQKPPTFLFLKDNEVIGHITTLPVRLLVNTRLSSAHWVVGFMVLPEYRNGPIGPLLIKKVNQTLDLAMTLHVEESALKIFKGLGWRHLGMIPQYVYILNPHRLLRNVQIGRMAFLRKYSVAWSSLLELIVTYRLTRFLLASLSALVFRAFSLGTALLRPTGRMGKVMEEEEFDATYDALWERVRDKFDALIVRDRAYLESRFGKQIKNYRLLACRDKGNLLGYCILKIKPFLNDSGMGNTKMGSIIDCLFDPEDLKGLQPLLDSAIKLFRRERVDVAFCSASHSQIQKLLSLNGFMMVPGNLHFAYYTKTGKFHENLCLASWHLMRGDSDADQNF